MSSSSRDRSHEMNAARAQREIMRFASGSMPHLHTRPSGFNDDVIKQFHKKLNSELTQLRAENEQLQEKLKRKENQLIASQQRNELLSKLQKELATYKNMVVQLQLENQQLRQRYERSQRKVHELQLRLANIEQLPTNIELASNAYSSSTQTRLDLDDFKETISNNSDDAVVRPSKSLQHATTELISSEQHARRASSPTSFNAGKKSFSVNDLSGYAGPIRYDSAEPIDETIPTDESVPHMRQSESVPTFRDAALPQSYPNEEKKTTTIMTTAPKSMEPRPKKKIRRKLVVYKVNGERIKIYDCYEPIKLLGRGTYAMVVEAVNKTSDEHVAIKKNRNVFASLEHAKRILREIKVLTHFNHPNIVSLMNVIVPEHSHREIFNDIYLVFEKMETTLTKVISNAEELSEEHIQYLTYQMLCGLYYIHSSGVIHRDVKPDNMLVNTDCALKICDFGLARGVSNEDEDAQMTQYVVTRYYRAPELLCQSVSYNAAVDIWSVGCIMAEMFNREVLFAGDNQLHQLKIIFENLGKPSDLSWVATAHCRDWIDEIKTPPPSPSTTVLSKLVPRASEEAIDFLQKLLTIDPRQRCSVEEALNHEWLSDFYDDEEIISCDEFSLPTDFEAKINSLFGVRHTMYEELKSFQTNRIRRIGETETMSLHGSDISSMRSNDMY